MMNMSTVPINLRNMCGNVEGDILWGLEQYISSDEMEKIKSPGGRWVIYSLEKLQKMISKLLPSPLRNTVLDSTMCKLCHSFS